MAYQGMYLLSAKISGIKNIRECINLEFYKKTIDKNFDPEKYRVKGIFGENGFGKTAIISAFGILRSLILDPGYLNNPENQEYLSETINKATKSFNITCEFLRGHNDKLVIYEYSVTLVKVGENYRIESERLRHRSGNSVKTQNVMSYSVKEGVIDYYYDKDKFDSIKISTMNLLSFSTLSSLILEKSEDRSEFDEVYYPLMIFAASIMPVLSKEDIHEIELFKNVITKQYSDPERRDPEVRDIIDRLDIYGSVNSKIVHDYELSLFRKRVKDMETFIKLFKPDLIAIDIETKQNGEDYICDLNMNYGKYQINSEYESTGIRKLMSLYEALRVAVNGGVVFIDEIDANINSIYLNTLIEYIMIYGKGQLCFTSHNTDIMNVLKDNKMSIDFLTREQKIVPWISNGNRSPVSSYKNGLIEGIPFNIYPTDYVGMFGDC